MQLFKHQRFQSVQPIEKHIQHTGHIITFFHREIASLLGIICTCDVSDSSRSQQLTRIIHYMVTERCYNS